MSTAAETWWAILGIGATGIVTRCSFLVFGERLVLPAAVERALRLAPAAALAATVAPSVVMADASPLGALLSPRLIAAVVAAAVMWKSRQMIWSMAAGVAVYTGIRLLLAA